MAAIWRCNEADGDMAGQTWDGKGPGGCPSDGAHVSTWPDGAGGENNASRGAAPRHTACIGVGDRGGGLPDREAEYPIEGKSRDRIWRRMGHGVLSSWLSISNQLVMSSGSDISNAASASTSTFVTALVFNAIVFGAEIAAFTLVRPYFPAIYQPRTYAPPEDKRAQALTGTTLLNKLSWPLAVWRADFRAIKDVNGMDAYFFVRFLRMVARILLPIWIISWVILLPVDAAGTVVSGRHGLDKYSFGNISPDKQSRYAAHLILTYISTFWVWWNIRREMRHFIITRQRWLIDPNYATSAQASTVLIRGVPQRYLTEVAMRQLFSSLPGGVAKVWLNRDLKEMPDLYQRRMKACARLESAETKLLNTAVKLRNKKAKAEAKAEKKGKGKGKGEKLEPPRTSDAKPLTAPSIAETDPETTVSLAEILVPKKKRPTHRLPVFSWMPFSLPLVGKLVDSIDWARQEILDTSAELKDCRRKLAVDVASSSTIPEPQTNHPEALKPTTGDQTYPPYNSAFVLFNRQIAAHLAAQALTHHEPYRIADRHLSLDPEDVIWGNLNMNPYEARIRIAISWGITVGLIILWAFAVAVDLRPTKHCRWHHQRYSPTGATRHFDDAAPHCVTAAEPLRGYTDQDGNGAESDDAVLPFPGSAFDSIPALLAQNLPKASNFFLTYIILQGLSGTASGFLQVVPLVLYYVKLFILGSTPRSIYGIKYGLRNVAWGTLFPSTTLLVVIALAYSIISPIINGLASTNPSRAIPEDYSSHRLSSTSSLGYTSNKSVLPRSSSSLKTKITTRARSQRARLWSCLSPSPPSSISSSTTPTDRLSRRSP
ncbi:hypothetical protein NM688_g8420 [Phlebia brevispora]|uniref:Uncharacterized protein n=1 Tax=Phlebia brevispora TaxID=194682 RepID=A0ACC1RUN4_9APHY|nr:hypothetical protein NM688_g8420 [Phlebia brevispora]